MYSEFKMVQTNINNGDFLRFSVRKRGFLEHINFENKYKEWNITL